MATLKSKLRGSLMSSRGVRKNTRNNLWIVYSPKLGLDISLASNKEAIYWLTALEINPDVKEFYFGFQAKLSLSPTEKKYRFIEVIKVVYSDGRDEFHYLPTANDEDSRADVWYLDEREVERKICFVHISNRYLVMRSVVAARLLHVISFVAQFREELSLLENNEVLNAIKMLGRGTVSDVLVKCSSQDPMVTLGVISAMILSGEVRIDMEMKSFGRQSFWSVS